MGHAVAYLLAAIGLLVPAVIAATIIIGPITLAWLWITDRIDRRHYR